MKNPIYPCIWCDNKAKEMATYYCSVFKNSKIISEHPLVVKADLNGRQFMFLNGGPQFTPDEAISFVIDCETQEEIDYYWNTLTKGGQESMCGWLKDKYGISWQVVPVILGELISDPKKGQAVMDTFLKMRKFDIPTLLSVK